MANKRPCRICRHWFEAHRRAGERQKVCGHPACQRERHRRSCRAWRDREAAADRTERLRRRVCRAETGSRSEPVSGALDWDAVRDTVGLQTATIMREIAKVLDRTLRDTVGQQAMVLQRESGKVGVAGPQDGIAPIARPP